MANRVGSPSAVSPFCMLAYTYGKLQLTNGPVNTFFRPLTPLAHGPFVRSPSLLPFHRFGRLALPLLLLRGARVTCPDSCTASLPATGISFSSFARQPTHSP